MSGSRKNLGEVLTLQRSFDLPVNDREPGPYPVAVRDPEFVDHAVSVPSSGSTSSEIVHLHDLGVGVLVSVPSSGSTSSERTGVHQVDLGVGVSVPSSGSTSSEHFTTAIEAFRFHSFSTLIWVD